MKTNRYKILMSTLILFLILFNFKTFASNGGSTGVGGGGDVVILPDDTVVLADPWIDSNAPQPNNMPPLRALNPRILQLTSLYAKSAASLLKSLSPNFIVSDIEVEIRKLSTRSSGLRFYAVQDQNELNTFCASGGKKVYKLPTGYSVSQVACTSGDETFLIEPIFIKLSLRDQVLLLIHERLTTLRDKLGGKNYSAIARFTTGMGVYLDVYNKESKSNYPVLSDDETKKLSSFYTAIEEIQFRDSDPNSNSFEWVAHPNGGGRIHNSSDVNSTAIISIDSVVSSNSTIGSNSKIIHSFLSSNFTTGEGSIIKNSYFESDNNSSLGIGKNTTILNSIIKVDQNLIIGDDQKMSDGSITSETLASYFPLGYEVKAISINWKDDLEWHTSDMLNKEGFQKQIEGHSHLSLKMTPVYTKIQEHPGGVFSQSKPTDFYFNMSYAIYLTSKLNTDMNKYVVQDGMIFKAGYERFGRIVLFNMDYVQVSSGPSASTIVHDAIERKLMTMGLSQTYSKEHLLYGYTEFIVEYQFVKL